MIGYLVVVIASFALVPFLGSNFFPSVDSGQITLHVRPPVGTRIEDASAMFGEIEKQIRKTIPAAEISSIVDNMGLPISAINMVYNNSGIIGYQDGDIFVSLNSNHHATADYVRNCASACQPCFQARPFVPAGRYRKSDPEFRLTGAA